MFPIFQVDLYNRTEIVDLSEYTPNGEWQLLGKPKITRLIRVKQSGCGLRIIIALNLYSSRAQDGPQEIDRN